MLKLWGMQCSSSLLSLPGPLRPGIVAADRLLFLGQIELKCVRTVFRTVFKLNQAVYFS